MRVHNMYSLNIYYSTDLQVGLQSMWYRRTRQQSSTSEMDRFSDGEYGRPMGREKGIERCFLVIKNRSDFK